MSAKKIVRAELTPAIQRRLERLRRVIEIFRNQDPELKKAGTLNLMQTFLTVAVSAPGEAYQRDIVEFLRLSQPSVFAHIQHLGEPTFKDPKALRLVTSDYDEENRTRKRLYLTEAGVSLAVRIALAMQVREAPDGAE